MTLFKKVFQHQGKAVVTESDDASPIPPLEERVMPENIHDIPANDELQPEANLDVYVLGPSEEVYDAPQDDPSAIEDSPEEANELIDDSTSVASDEWNEPDLAYVLEQTRPDEGAEDASAVVPATEDDTEDAGELEQAHVDVDAPEEITPDAKSEEEDTPVIDMMDVAAFAREQMRAAGLAAPEPTPTATADVPHTQPIATAPDDAVVGRAGRRAGRVKTRLLGFNRGAPDTTDPFDSSQVETAIQGRGKFPVGWLVVVDGPGTGHSFALFSGASMIGRGEDQVIKLDFGDNSISRQNHAAIAYDDEENKFFIGHGGKSNIIRLNARPVLSTEELHHTDLVRIGETTLRFVALCGKDFQWDHTGGPDATAV